MKLNKEELIIGLIFGLCFFPLISWLALPIALATSFLWAYTGAGASKLYRRLLVPSLPAVAVAVVKHNWFALASIPLAFAVLSLGYGIPDSSDEGSVIGLAALKLAKNNQSFAQIYCRSFIYTLLLLAFLPCLLAN